MRATVNLTPGIEAEVARLRWEHVAVEVQIGPPWQSLSAFLRISTHRRIMGSPLTGEAAAGFVDDWLVAPTSCLPDVRTATWVILRSLIRTHRVTGNLVPDRSSPHSRFSTAYPWSAPTPTSPASAGSPGTTPSLDAGRDLRGYLEAR